jgi:uncharacterized protein (DUF2267 family)
MPHQLEHYAAKGNALLNELATELGIPGNKKAAARILRAVLHALRDRITVEESLQLLAQLPMVIKGIYVDGWTLKNQHKHTRTVDQFLFDVIRNDGIAALDDFTLNREEARIVVERVFFVLSRQVSEGELRNIIAVLPGEIKLLVEESIC